MARTAITAIAVPSAYTGGVVGTFTALDPANKNSLRITGQEILIFNNTNVGAQSITISSVADEYGRTKDVTKSMDASSYYVFGGRGCPLEGYQQADGCLYFEAASADVKVMALTLPIYNHV